MKNISKTKLLELYAIMLRIRLTELKIEELYPKNEMKTPIHLCIGQEAVPAGVMANLNKDDYIFSNHRCHGHYLAKGGNLKAMIAELYGKIGGSSKGRGGSMHLIDTSCGFMGSSSIIGGAIPLATGAALGSKLRNDKKVSVVFFGDAGVEQGVLYESANFASLKKLPVIYICENNFYSVCSPVCKRQPDDKLYKRLKGFSIPGFEVDGNDVLKVYNISKKAIKYSRSGNGPSFIECKTYRFRDHAGSGVDLRLEYRPKKELEAWLKKCPVENFEKFLFKKRLLNQNKKDSIVKNIKEELNDAFKFAKKCPLPKENEISKYLYNN